MRRLLAVALLSLLSLSAEGPRSWRSGTALLARPMVELSNGSSQPSMACTAGGATASSVARSRLPMASSSSDGLCMGAYSTLVV